jgi:hypothetical protein
VPREVLTIVTITLGQAQEFVARVHRHHKPSIGHKWSIGVVDNTGTLRGVAMIGRPVARALDDGITLEVTRVATDGCRNACSILYGAARRAAKALGYARILTYTLAEEDGASLRAAGWVMTSSSCGGGTWNNASRHRVDQHPLGLKKRWEGW